MAKLGSAANGASKIVREVAEKVDLPKAMPKRKPHTAPRPKTDPPAPKPDPKGQHPKHPDRNNDGTYRGGAPNGGKVKEQEMLDKLESQYGPIERKQCLARVDGADNGRYYDGLVPTGTDPATGLPTYSGIEIKSGDARLTGPQRDFDAQVSPTNPARATLNGQPILITTVLPVVRA